MVRPESEFVQIMLHVLLADRNVSAAHRMLEHPPEAFDMVCVNDRAMIRAWSADFNEVRPHSALGYQTPKPFAERQFTATVPDGVSIQSTLVPAGRKFSSRSLHPFRDAYTM